MKKMFYSIIRLYASVALCAGCVGMLSLGCASTEPASTPTAEHSKAHSTIVKKDFSDLDRALTNAKRKQRKLMYELDHAQSTDEIIRCKDKLNKINAEIKDIQKHKDDIAAPEEEGFKSVKDRHYTYGPLGIVFKATQWILEKLYLIDQS